MLQKSSLNVSDSGEAHKMCPFDPLDNVTSIYIGKLICIYPTYWKNGI